MEEKKFTLKAKKDKDEEYSIYYPKTTWDNVLTEDDKCIDTYLDENFYKKGEIDSNFVKVGAPGDYYTRAEIDEKITQVNDDLFKMDEAHTRKYISNDYSTNSSIKAPSMNLFKKTVEQNTNKITEITETILDIENSNDKVFVNDNGKISDYKVIVFDIAFTLSVNTSDNVYIQKTVSLPSKVSLSTIIYSHIQLASDDYICRIKSTNLSEGLLYLSVGKITNKFMEDMDIKATAFIVGK